MRILILILCGILFSSVEAQEPSAPFGAIEDFFKAFHNKEAKVLSTAFSESAVMQRAVHQEGKSVLIQQDISNFIKRVASRPDTPVWEEALGAPLVHQSANLATVWVPFRFYLDGKFSHCGVNQCTLFWNGNQWKIIHLIDTSETCEAD